MLGNIIILIDASKKCTLYTYTFWTVSHVSLHPKLSIIAAIKANEPENNRNKISTIKMILFLKKRNFYFYSINQF